MNTKRFASVPVALFLLTVFIASAQDKLYRINPKKVIDCKVIEIGEELIRYTSSQYSAELTFTVDKNYVEKIEFANGEVMTFSNSMFGSEHYESQRKHALKFTFLSPVMGYTELGYERSLKPGQSMDYSLAIIGLGISPNSRYDAGFALRAGYKFMTSPTYYQSRQRYAHILKGAYVKPEVSLLYYSGDYTENEYYYSDYQNYYSTTSPRSQTVILGAINIIGGKQWVFSDRFLIDLYAGIGYAFGKYPASDDGYNYIFTGGQKEVPLTFTWGFRIGLLL